jgi:hypothetical protein
MEENPTTHLCFILMKSKKEKAFEKRKIHGESTPLSS